MTAQHGPESGRVHRLTRRLALARAAEHDDPKAYARAEARRLARILAEG